MLYCRNDSQRGYAYRTIFRVSRNTCWMIRQNPKAPIDLTDYEADQNNSGYGGNHPERVHEKVSNFFAELIEEVKDNPANHHSASDLKH